MVLFSTQSTVPTTITRLVGIIGCGILGATCFTVGMLMNIEILTIIGLCMLVLCIIGLLLYYILTNPLQQQQQQQIHLSTATAVPTHYSTNNMNTMTRNKSDTDLELINRESEKNEQV